MCRGSLSFPCTALLCLAFAVPSNALLCLCWSVPFIYLLCHSEALHFDSLPCRCGAVLCFAFPLLCASMPSQSDQCYATATQIRAMLFPCIAKRSGAMPLLCYSLLGSAVAPRLLARPFLCCEEQSLLTYALAFIAGLFLAFAMRFGAMPSRCSSKLHNAIAVRCISWHRTAVPLRISP